MKRELIIVILFLSTFGAGAQSELTLPFMGNVFQSTYLNPAARSEHTFSLGLPILSSIQFQVIHNGFVPNSFLKLEDGILTISPKNLDKQLRDRNMLFANGAIDLFHFKMRIFNWDFWYASRQNHEIAFFYPKSLFSFAIEGTSQYVDDPLDLSPLGLNASIYREHTFGAATERGKWVFGGRFSIMHGLTNAYLDPSILEIRFEDEMFAITAETEAVLYTSGIPGDSLKNININAFSNFGDVNIGSYADFKDFLQTNYAANYLTRFRNPGYAISGGVSYRFDSKTTFSFAFSDLGYITWSDSTKMLTVNGKTEFEGLAALSDMLSGNEMAIDTLINEFLGNFKTDEDFDQQYKTWLSPKFYLAANYQLARRTNVGAHVYAVMNRRLYPAFSVGVTQGLSRTFNLALSAAFNQRTITNIGFGMILKPGPFQVYLLADNVYAPLVDPFTFTNFNLRFGVNVVFGRIKTQQGLPYM